MRGKKESEALTLNLLSWSFFIYVTLLMGNVFWFLTRWGVIKWMHLSKNEPFPITSLSGGSSIQAILFVYLNSISSHSFSLVVFAHSFLNRSAAKQALGWGQWRQLLLSYLIARINHRLNQSPEVHLHNNKRKQLDMHILSKVLCLSNCSICNS